ncbi:unnamed protein product, partial [Adineta steineri]
MPLFKCEDVTCKSSPLTDSCMIKREQLLFETMDNIKDESIYYQCWYAFLCVFSYSKDPFDTRCNDFCKYHICLLMIKQDCPNMLFIPTIPVLFGDIYFAYEKYSPTMLDYRKFLFPYICYSNSRYNNLIYHRGIHPELFQQPDVFPSPQFYLQHLHSKLWQYHEIYNYNSIICNRSNMYQCSNSLKCISIHRRMNANDGRVDCIGATDEPTLCRKEYQIMNLDNFYCKKQNSKVCIGTWDLCNSLNACDDRDYKNFCTTYKNQTSSFCDPSERLNVSNIENYLCNQVGIYGKERIINFTLNGMKESLKDQTKQHIKNEVRLSPPITVTSIQQQLHCHRGIDVRIWLNDKTNRTRKICFCPPSYYGDQCQYQNQPVSLSIKFTTSPNSWQIPFAIVILLIDDDNNKQIIHSYEQITYLSTRDCKVKYNIYLLYSNRPKNQTKNYGIQFNIYEKISLKYRGSLFFPIKFSFLPVYRLALIANIPNDNIHFESCSNNRCINGKCIKYFNDKQKRLCHCNTGWSGRYCTIQHSSICSSDSLDIGISSSTDQSICICPIYKFGPRCLLNNMICQNLTCQNGVLCIPTDEYMLSKKRFICICRKGYFGERYELEDNKIILSFEKSIIVPQSIFIHFIEVMNRDRPVRST